MFSFQRHECEPGMFLAEQRRHGYEPECIRCGGTGARVFFSEATGG